MIAGIKRVSYHHRKNTVDRDRLLTLNPCSCHLLVTQLQLPNPERQGLRVWVWRMKTLRLNLVKILDAHRQTHSIVNGRLAT